MYGSIGLDDDGGSEATVMDLGSCDLFSLIDFKKGNRSRDCGVEEISPEDKVSIVKDLIKGVIALHVHGIVHAVQDDTWNPQANLGTCLRSQEIKVLVPRYAACVPVPFEPTSPER